MSKLRKTAHKVVKKSHQVLNPVGYKLYGEKALDKTADWTSENVWNDPVAPEADPATAAATPMVMPDTDDEALAKARRKRIAAQRARSGRTSTVLSDTDGLGG